MIVTTQNMIDRTRRTYYANYPSDDSTLTDNEILLHINDAVAAVITKQATEGYQLTGIMSVPEGYISTFTFTSLIKDNDTGFYYTTIPHPPIGLSGNSGVESVFFSGFSGTSRPVLYVSPREVDYFRFMPSHPMAAYYWIEGTTLYFFSRTNLPSTYKLQLRMATHVTSDLNAPINVPPDAIDLVYKLTLEKLVQRKGLAGDDIVDSRDK